MRKIWYILLIQAYLDVVKFPLKKWMCSSAYIRKRELVKRH